MKTKLRYKKVIYRKKFECEPRCEFPKLTHLVFSCDKCLKHTQITLTPKQIEEILVILNAI